MKRLFGALLLTGAAMLFVNTEAGAVRYPLNTWEWGCNTFWSSCARSYHTGVDAYGSAGTPVYAPFAGWVKEAQYHDGYGGTIIVEGYEGGEYICAVLGHLQISSFVVRAGQYVSEGQYLCTTGRYGKDTGWYPEHLHYGVRKGRYQTGTTCDGGWKYHGYAADCDRANWNNPLLFTPFANAHRASGGVSRVGYPTNDFHDWCGTQVRDFGNGSYGWCIIIHRNPDAWLVRTGFWEKYRQMGGPCSWLGKPRNSEYTWNGRARQDFDGGYMLWFGSYTAVYNTGGQRVLSESQEIMPLETWLRVSPNPTTGRSMIRFSLAEEGPVTIEVFDVTGRLVRVVVDEVRSTGEQQVPWDGKDGAGNAAASGIYFVRLATPADRTSQRLLLLR